MASSVRNEIQSISETPIRHLDFKFAEESLTSSKRQFEFDFVEKMILTTVSQMIKNEENCELYERISWCEEGSLLISLTGKFYNPSLLAQRVLILCNDKPISHCLDNASLCCEIRVSKRFINLEISPKSYLAPRVKIS